MSNQVAEVSAKYLSDVATNGVPVGYKQTEVGVIPENWEVISIGEALLAKSLVDQMDGNHGELYPKSHEFSSFGVPYIGATDFYSGNIDYKNCKYLPIQRAKKFKKGIAKNGDVLFAHNATVGPVALVETELDFIIISTTATYYRCNKDEIDNVYLASYFRSETFVKQFSSVMSQSTRNQVPILAQRKFLLVLPPVQEQTAIANALSDVDALISELEKLIAKKQAIKTATMQQLLTGRTRLPQFALRADGTPKGTKPSELGEIPEDWDLKTVFELAGCQKSLFDDGDWIEAEHITDKGVRLIQTGNIGVGRYIEKDAKKYIFEESFEKLKCKELRKGDLLICRLAEPAGRSCILPDIGEDKVITSVDVTIFRPSSEVANREFYNQYFSSSDWFKSVLEQVGGTTHKRISRGALGRISVCYPNAEEQSAIATILSDMDSEIQALEQRLGKTRQIKQGMMQELLTGKTRLVQPSLTGVCHAD